ncbi:radical SAM protein [Flavivirga abyssicola]|uniref:radical SAM protein n=1 Tax=Flavivirga abyssicola TaxID=3063533 RepID=UPI0026E09637|nr:radical SAM protein [Flavivirga sp. MEBiC07777]WVK14722.1 radical SAM protein [Flavivirga sp. MEBiC07777]
MNIYKLLKLNRKIKGHRLKFFAIWLLHVFNKRYLAVNLDPVLACNLRCKMCYFTDKEYVKKLKGQFKEEDLDLVAKRIFKRALKLQIGCGTEPTLYKKLSDIVKLGKEYKVPYISLTTNANLLNEYKIQELLEAGLNEFTISLHGVTKATYESFMKKASYEKFHEVFNTFKKLKKKYDFHVRINYTFNKDNFYELSDLFEHFDGESFDILQVRPIRKIGNTEYNDFNLDNIREDYPKLIKQIKEKCVANNITLLASDKIAKRNSVNSSSFIYDYTFCYISPDTFWREDFNWRKETFNEYAKKNGWGKKLLSNIFKSKKELTSFTNRLNYEIELN